MADQKPTLDYGRPESNRKTRYSKEKRALGAVGVCLFGAIAAYCVQTDFPPGVILFAIATIGFAFIAAGVIR
jgi:chromate transport protein ChrA